MCAEISARYRRGDVAELLAERVKAAAHAAFGIDLADALIRPASAGRAGDYQCNAVMALAKQRGEPSRTVAGRMVEHLDVLDLVDDVSIGGPGFINLRLRDDWLAQRVADMAADQRLAVPLADPSHRVVLDVSSPNVAKEMHVGHLRSTIIGDSLIRLLRFVGHEVIPQNHVGDWGTPFGMLVEHLLDLDDERSDPEIVQQRSIADLDEFYRQARQKFDADPAFAERARQRVVALQGGDEATLQLWRELVDESLRHMDAIYRLLNVDFARGDVRGESFYNPVLSAIAAELEDRGLAVISDGALCAFPAGFTNKQGEPMPLIVRKRDGGYTYDTTDLATAKFRAQDLAADDMIYVVDAGQQLHFAMIFAVAREAGWIPPDVRTVHVTFGVVLGEDGRRLRTRAGENVKLNDLLAEAVDRAAAVVAERGQLPADERGRVAEAVGIGAVKYADLSSDRDSDYVFSWQRMLSLEGNTAVYLQYANARIHSVLRKVGGGAELASAAATVGSGPRVALHHPAERALALALARYPAAVQAAAEHLQPHRICGYLYELATAFSAFYENCPIATEPAEEIRSSRIAISALTSRVLENGLDLLGIAAPPRL